MARLLTADEIRALPPGSVIYEEWIFGTAPLKIEIVEQLSENRIRTKIYIDVGGGKLCEWVPMQTGADDVLDLTDHEFRWWDSEPTFEERETTVWKGGK